MRPGGLFGRIAQWLANEIIVKGLSNSPAFQRFAVRSSEQARELSKSAAEAAKNLSELKSVQQLRKVSQGWALTVCSLDAALSFRTLTFITVLCSCTDRNVSMLAVIVCK